MGDNYLLPSLFSIVTQLVHITKIWISNYIVHGDMFLEGQCGETAARGSRGCVV